MPAQRSSNVAVQKDPAVRVFTLGRFRVEVAGAPLRFGRKAQRRPMDLLKLLIAYGGEAVSTEQLAEDLWADSEGDAAQAALRTTVSRLRNLLGSKAILSAGHALTLNPEVCWVDALELARRLAECRHGAQGKCREDGHSMLEDALSLYRGDFLPGECNMPPMLSARARLRSAVLRHLADLGHCYEQSGELDRAMNAYRKGLEVDPSAEEIVRRLIRCCAKSGRAAEGIAVYRSSQAALKTQLGAAPSAATRAAYQELVLASGGESAGGVRNAPTLVAPVFGSGPGALTIAVLPFEDLSLTGDHRRLARAIREGIISLLGVLPQISVVTQLDAGHDPIRFVSGGLQKPKGAARYLLRGNVMIVKDRLRTSVTLTDNRTGRYAWSEQLDHVLGDVIEAQDEVAIKVADRIADKLIFGSYTAMLLSPRIDVWKAVALARTYSMQQRRQGYRRARVLINTIAESAPDDPNLLAASATLHVCEARQRLVADPLQSLLAGERTFHRLRARYANETPTIPSWGWSCALRGEFGEARLLGQREVERSPENFVAHAMLGLSLLYQDQRAEAMASLQDAFDACPQPPAWLYKDRAIVQFCNGAYDESAHDLAAVLRDPSHQESEMLNVRMIHIATLAAGGRVEEARHAARTTVVAHPGVSTRRWGAWHFQPHKVGSPASRIARLLVASGMPL